MLYFSRYVATATAVLLLLLPNCSCAAADDMCDVQLTDIDDSFGTQQAFYKIAQGIAKKIQKNLNDKDLDTISQIWSENGIQYDTIYHAVGKILKKEIALIIMLVIGAVYIVAMLIFGIIYCCARCKNRCGGPGTKFKYVNARSTWTLPIFVAILVVGLAFIIAGICVYGVSIQDANDDIDYIQDVLPKIISDLSCTIRNLSQSVVDESKGSFNSSFTQIYEHLDTFIKNITDAEKCQLETLFNETTNISEKISEILNSSESLGFNVKEILNTTKENINDTVNEVKEFENNLYDEINEIEESINKTRNASNKIQPVIDDASMQLKEGVDTIDEKISDVTNLVEKYANHIASFSGRKAIKNGLKAVVIVPVLLVAVAVVFLILFAFLRIFQNVCRLNWTTKVVKHGGKIAVFGIVIAFVFAWLLMLYSCFLLLIGFTVEAACKPFFYDEQMTIFEHIPKLQYNITNPIKENHIMSIHVGEILNRCSQNSTIIKALNGNDMFDVDSIAARINLAEHRNKTVTEIVNLNITFNVDFSSIENDTVALTALNLNNTEVQELISTLNDFITELNEMKNKNYTDELIEKVNKLFDDLESSLQEAVNNIDINTCSCKPLYDLWQNIGKLTCNRIGRPLQGMWASVGLVAVIYIPIIITMIMVSGILYERKRQKPGRYFEDESHQNLPTNRPNDSLSADYFISQVSPHHRRNPTYLENIHNPQPAIRIQKRRQY